jgi:heterodisulfide reductase subunit B
MESTASAYQLSLLAICGPLGLDLEEIQDWNCCGATEYVSLSLTPAYALIGRNLALAAEQAQGTRTVVAPCSACYLNLAKADHYMKERPTLNTKVNQALAAGGLRYQPGTLSIRHLLDVLVYDVGLERIRERVVRPLTGLRVAPYLGCMVPRPDYEGRWSSHDYPTELDRVLQALGAEVIDFPLKTHCCGGHMTHISPPVAFELLRRLLHTAADYNADLMATLCPMCQLNVDGYQGEVNRYFHANYRMPVIFFTQLIGLAFGLEPKALGFGRELVDAGPALAHIGVETPPAAATPAGPRPRRGQPEGLPMPSMPPK